MKPETRARTSTLSTATNRPVYSSHSVICFCNGRATVTGGGGGAAPAACLVSQPVSAWATSARKPNKAARMMTAGMGLSSGIASIIAYNPTKCCTAVAALHATPAPAIQSCFWMMRPPMYTDRARSVGGEWKNGGGRNGEDVINPATEKPLARLPHASTGDLDAALAAAGKGLAVWRATSAYDRAKVL